MLVGVAEGTVCTPYDYSSEWIFHRAEIKAYRSGRSGIKERLRPSCPSWTKGTEWPIREQRNPLRSSSPVTQQWEPAEVAHLFMGGWEAMDCYGIERNYEIKLTCGTDGPLSWREDSWPQTVWFYQEGLVKQMQMFPDSQSFHHWTQIGKPSKLYIQECRMHAD